MDIRDLKEGQEVYVKGRVIHTGDHLDIVLDEGSFIENAIVLHYKKTVVPQFVADIIEYYKSQRAPINDVFGEKYSNEQYRKWLINEPNAYDIVARAWFFGYEVEKEKRYLVKMKNVSPECECLYWGMLSKTWLFKVEDIYGEFRKHHTRKDLEDAGFGWVFDCQGVEIEEVEG